MKLRGYDVADRDLLLDELRDEGRRVLMSAGVSADQVRFRYGIDARYAGQGNEITVWVDEGEGFTVGVDEVELAYEDEYRRVYGMAIPDVAIEVVTWRLSASAELPAVEPGPPNPTSTDRPAPLGNRRVVFDRGATAVETPVHRRELLPTGIRLEGPVIVEERDTTSVIRPGWSMEVADDGSLVAIRERQ